MKLMRIIVHVLKSLKHNFCFAAKHIASKQNAICNKLSRFQIAEAKAVAKHLQELPVPYVVICLLFPLVTNCPATLIHVSLSLYSA